MAVDSRGNEKKKEVFFFEHVFWSLTESFEIQIV